MVNEIQSGLAIYRRRNEPISFPVEYVDGHSDLTQVVRFRIGRPVSFQILFSAVIEGLEHSRIWTEE